MAKDFGQAFRTGCRLVLAADRWMMKGVAFTDRCGLPRSISRIFHYHLSIFNTAVGIRVGFVGFCRLVNISQQKFVGFCRNLFLSGYIIQA